MITLAACGPAATATPSAADKPASQPTATTPPAQPTATTASSPAPSPTATGLPEPSATPTPLPTPEPAPPPTDEAALTGAVTGNPDLDFAQVTFVQATQGQDGLWRFDTTVRHNDQGWDHYADAWQVVDPATDKVLAERILLHPHDTEQPFTRSQSGIEIPPELTLVLVRAKCNVHGFGGQAVMVDLTAGSGEGFEVIRP